MSLNPAEAGRGSMRIPDWRTLVEVTMARAHSPVLFAGYWNSININEVYLHDACYFFQIGEAFALLPTLFLPVLVNWASLDRAISETYHCRTPSE